MDEADRLAIGLLATSVSELITLVGKLNALTGVATEQHTAQHIELKEALLDLMASVTRVADRFAPPTPPE